MLEQREIEKYLETVKYIKQSYELYDTHVHPLEVVFDRIRYRVNPACRDLYSVDGLEFRPPGISPLKMNVEQCEKVLPGIWSRSNILSMIMTSLYSHTGPAVFNAHMGLSGIDRILLLPVAPSSGPGDTQLPLMAKMFGQNKKFLYGCSVPNCVPNQKVKGFVKDMVNRYHVKAVKLHPNITEIDLSSSAGKERVEGILTACGDFGLPLIVHGGSNAVLPNPKAAVYGAIQNLKDIDWGISRAAVVIAHAGAYCQAMSDTEREILPALKRMLKRYGNIMVDLSGLGIDIVMTVIRSIGTERIVFGSDALYEQQWASLVRLLLALEKTGNDVEEGLVQIACRNVETYLFRRERQPEMVENL